MSFRNEWRLFRKKDALTGEEIYSSFSPASPVKIYETNYWNSDAWDPMDYGRDYDFGRSFFEQFRELLETVPIQSRVVRDLENSDYSINATGAKNCYLVASVSYIEDSAYVVSDYGSKSCFDCRMINSCELCYGSLNLANCYGTFFSKNCEGCRNVVLSKDLIGCSDCFGCVNLRNKQYYIFNKSYTKEEYEAKLAALNLGSYQAFQELAAQVRAFWLHYPEKFYKGSNNDDVSGNYIYQSKNVHNSWRVTGGEDSKFCQNIIQGPATDCYDYTNWGQNVQLMCETLQCGDHLANVKFSMGCWLNSHDLTYCAYCFRGNSNLFGCVSLHNKQYCILNKQYTKEEYESLVPRIIAQMNELPYIDKLSRIYKYGEFFPSELSPLEYNNTIAQEFFPLTKEQALAQGLTWHDAEERQLTTDLAIDELPDNIADVSEDLVGKVIACAHGGQCADECTKGFRIISQELAFLIEQRLPLPRLCPNCRQFELIKERSPFKLYNRTCECAGTTSLAKGANQYTNSIVHEQHGTAPCPIVFDTTYAPDRPETVYCETCYQAEVV